MAGFRDAQSNFTAWCAAQGVGRGAAAGAGGNSGDSGDSGKRAGVPVVVLAEYLEGLGFPNTAETRALIGSVCQSAAGRRAGLREPSEFCPVFMPAFRAALEQMRAGRTRVDTGSDDSDSDGDEGDKGAGEGEEVGEEDAVGTAAAAAIRVDGERGSSNARSSSPANVALTRRMASDVAITTDEIQDLLSTATVESHILAARGGDAAGEVVVEEEGGGGETKADGDAADERGLIDNPTPQSKDQLPFGGFLNLKQVDPGSWTDRGVHMSWSSVPSAHFSVRGSNYLSNRIKEESDFAIYEPVSMDIFQTEKRWFCTSDACWMPRVPVEKEINGMPSRLTIEITFPNFPAENAVWGTQKKNGPSHVWVASFVLSEQAKAQLRAGDYAMTPGLRLAREFCLPNDPHHSAFKTIIKMDNHEDPEVSDALGFMVKGLLSKYNAKPYLSNRSHRVVRVSEVAFCCHCCRFVMVFVGECSSSFLLPPHFQLVMT